MRFAIIGAGLSGLALAFHLLETGICQVDIFDEKGLGGGASGMACGLVHPYPGEECKRSWRADEAMACTDQLLNATSASVSRGIVRVARDEAARELLRYDDVEECSEGFLIKSGMTVDVPHYLEGLFKVCQQKGARLHLQKIKTLAELGGYDHIVVAAGAGLTLFPECAQLNVKFIKGQLLTCSYPDGFPALKRSLIGKGYVGVQKEGCVLGSTYERGYTSVEPDVELARRLILPKIASFFHEVVELEITGALSAVRVARNGHYKPILQKVGEGKWVMGAMGSRGLLYHALAAKELARAMVTNDISEIEKWEK